MDKIYRKDLDVLKGIAISAVVLFHLGIVKSGYLGVDVFLVINGFLIIPSICRKVASDKFSYLQFLKSRLKRLWPLVALLSIVCLAIGYVGMLPDDYENLGESVVASNLFSENILLSITTKDYWNVSNDFNPLMHLWYVGVIFEFYLLFPLIIMLIKRVGGGRFHDYGKTFVVVLSILFVASITLFLLPTYDYSTKFYYIPFRLFEFLLGGIGGLLLGDKDLWLNYNRTIYFSLIGVLCFMLLSSVLFLDVRSIGTDVLKIGGEDLPQERVLLLPKQMMLLVTVFLTFVLILLGNGNNLYKEGNGVLTFLGKRSYGVFIWHQAIIAFYRYFITTKITVLFLVVFFLMLFIVTEISYRLIETRFVKYKYSMIITAIVAFIACLGGGYVYLRAGVVRDVPELDVSYDEAQRGMHAAYVDRIYQYDVDFPERNGTINVIVEGISYGRDMANVLLESCYADSINLSYIYKWDSKYIDRIKNADVIFTFKNRLDVPKYVFDNMSRKCEIWGIGTKNYGNSNGNIYSKRASSDYFNQTVPLHPWYRETNETWKQSWGDNYIDFIKPSMIGENRVRIFTDNNKYISQDCYHLTRAGAKWYANQFDFSKVLR